MAVFGFGRDNSSGATALINTAPQSFTIGVADGGDASNDAAFAAAGTTINSAAQSVSSSVGSGSAKPA